MEIIGQENIKNIINGKTLDSFPHSLILNGPKGSGKHLIVNYICEKLNISSIDITDLISQETIENIDEKPIPTLYFINSDSSKFSEKSQNVILKLLEEPLKNAFIILLSENYKSLKNTIINRCQIWNMDYYKKEDLKKFLIDNNSENDLIISLATTPGMVKELSSIDIKEMFNLCNKVIDKLSVANISNALTISNKLAFTESETGFPIELFIQCLIYCMYIKIKEKHEINWIFLENIIQLQKDCKKRNVNKRYIFENFILRMKEIFKNNDIARINSNVK